MKKKKLIIGVSNLNQIVKGTIDACKRAERGLPVQPLVRISFEDQATLFSMLSPKRMELLKYLRQSNPMSTRLLARHLNRDYKNVYQDVKSLLRIGLIMQNKDQKFTVPWDDITIELSLAA